MKMIVLLSPNLDSLISPIWLHGHPSRAGKNEKNLFSNPAVSLVFIRQNHEDERKEQTNGRPGIDKTMEL